MINMMKYNTLQEVFDVVAEHLLKQGVQSRIETVDGLGNQDYVGCAYRSECGTLKCAVGVLIPEEKYTKKLEGTGVGHVLRCLDSWGVVEKDAVMHSLLTSLQKVHDESETMGFENWEKALIYVAKKHKLNTNKIKQNGN